MGTEARNPHSQRLDEMDALQIVRLMDREERRVYLALEGAAEGLARAAERVATSVRAGGRVIYLGSGTSGRIAAADAAEMPPTFGTDPSCFVAVVSGGAGAAERAVEDAEDDPAASVMRLNELGVEPRDAVIGLAASGTTPFVLAGVRHARQKGIWTCGIANNPGAPLLQAAEWPILLDTGPEVLTGSTRLKAGTAQKMALNRISTAAMVLSGKVIQNLMVDVKAKNAKLRDRCVRIVRELAPVTQDEARAALEASDWNIRAALARIGGPVSVG